MKKLFFTCSGLAFTLCCFAQQTKTTVKNSLIAVYADMPQPSAAPQKPSAIDT
ncbi:hypothetical protein [Flavisolibacter tropicus]|uniref:hypothetical protein n=1 Tax=Flavisolibacter tropicus TaxID=1492898 RepID=UPI001314F193|nr:hypothetical protein [Flavisolibacter tropicus]